MKSSMYGATLNSEVVIVSSQYLLYIILTTRSMNSALLRAPPKPLCLSNRLALMNADVN